MEHYDFEQLTVMVVDDNLMMRKLVEQLLHCFGVGTVIRAGNGEDALQVLADRHIDMVITDWMMEPLDGVEFVRRVRMAECSPNRLVPMLMMTGHSELWRVAAARDAGINEFIVKPITGDALLSRMIYMIEHPRAYVRTNTYFGPDRRRKVESPYFGPDRRSAGRDKHDGFMHLPSDQKTASTDDGTGPQHRDPAATDKVKMPA